MKVIFGDDSPICIGLGDNAKSFARARKSREPCSDDCLKKTNILAVSDDKRTGMSGERQGEDGSHYLSGVNAQVDARCLAHFPHYFK